MPRLARSLRAVALSLLALGALAPAASAEVYWVDSMTSSVGRANNNGGGANQYWLSSPAQPGGGIVVTADHVYWTGWGGEIWRANRNGTGTVQIVAGAGNATSLATDGDYLYWTDPNADAVGRAPIAGGTPDNAFIATGEAPEGVAVAGGHIYWTNGNDNSIGRANLDGSGVSNSFITGLNAPRHLASDGTSLYWADFYGRRVGRANLDGTGVQRTWFNLGYSVYGVALSGGALFWTEPGFGDMGRLILSSTSSSYIFDDGWNPLGIAATGPGFAAAPDALAFGDRNVSTTTTQTVTITNAPSGGAGDPLTFAANAITITGTNANQFAKTADTCSGQTIAVGGSCTVTVGFTPTSVGNKTASLRFVDNAAGSPQTVSLTGRGTQGAVIVSPVSLDLGGATVGATGPSQPVTVTNSATGATAGTVTIPDGGVTVIGPDASQFAIAEDGCAGETLDPGQSCTVRVAAAPTSAGDKSATLSIADDAPGTPHTVALTAIGRAPAVSTDPATLDFGAVPAARRSAPRTLTVRNSSSGPGADDLVFGTPAASLAGADADRFTILTDGCAGATLAPGEACAISVRFAPGGTGARTAVLELADDAPDAPQQVALIGTGTEAGFAVSPATHAFGTVAVGSASAPQTFTVTNTAIGPDAGPLTFDGGAVTLGGTGSAQFELTSDDCSGAELDPGDSCTVAVRFAPTAGGTHLAELRFSDDAPGSPQSAALAGVSPAPPAPTPPAPTPSSSGAASSDPVAPAPAAPSTTTPPAPESPSAPSAAPSSGNNSIVGVRVASRRVRVDHRGVARVALRCLGPRGRRCVGSVSVSGGRAPVAFHLRTGSRRTFEVTLRRSIGGCRTVRATVRMRLRQPNGTVQTRDRGVRLQPASCQR